MHIRVLTQLFWMFPLMSTIPPGFGWIFRSVLSIFVNGIIWSWRYQVQVFNTSIIKFTDKELIECQIHMEPVQVFKDLKKIVLVINYIVEWIEFNCISFFFFFALQKIGCALFPSWNHLNEKNENWIIFFKLFFCNINGPIKGISRKIFLSATVNVIFSHMNDKYFLPLPELTFFFKYGKHNDNLLEVSGHSEEKKPQKKQKRDFPRKLALVTSTSVIG